jgi:hypothetical protein
MRAKHSIAVLLLLIALCGTLVLKAGDDRFLNRASQSTLPRAAGSPPDSTPTPASAAIPP